MGVHICLYTESDREHPTWDWLRYAGDREFHTLASELPAIHSARDMDKIRPADLARWRAAVARREWPVPGRFEGLLDILADEPDYWLYFSV